MTVSAFWTPERAERVLVLAADGLLTRRIGEELGCTRNAVIGRLWRKGFRMRPPDSGPEQTIFDRLPDIPMTGCRWIEGDVHAGVWSYCGERVAEPGGSWCAKHRRRVFQMARPKE